MKRAKLRAGLPLIVCACVALAPIAARAQTGNETSAVTRRPLRVSLGVGSSLLWRVSDGYELFSAARAAFSVDGLVGVDVMRAGRFELEVLLGYRFDESGRRYAQTLGTALATHTMTVGATARFAVRPWFAVFGRAQGAGALWLARVAPDAGAELRSLSPSFGGVASVGAILRSGPLLGDSAALNAGLFVSAETGAQLFNDAQIDMTPSPSNNEAIAREALPVTGASVTRVNASTPFIRVMVGLRF